ncbi:MAG: hypothetical protein AAFX52_04950 [Pseudomonadota bacterium]
MVRVDGGNERSEQITENPPIESLSDVSYTSGVYTANSSSSLYCTPGAAFFFRPSAPNDVNGPRLSVNGETARQLHDASGKLKAGYLQPTEAYLIYRERALYRVIGGGGSMTIVRANNVRGIDGITYTANLPVGVPKVSHELLVQFSPSVGNRDKPTIAFKEYNNSEALSIRDSNSVRLSAGELNSASQYLGVISGKRFILINYVSTAEKKTKDEAFAAAVSLDRKLSSALMARQLGQVMSPLTNGGREREPVLVTSNHHRGWTASVGDEKRLPLIASKDLYIDYQHLRMGHTHRLIAKASTSLSFIDRTYTALAGTVVDVVRIDKKGNHLDFVVSGHPTPPHLDEKRSYLLPPREVCFITGGQSLAERCVSSGGLHGLQLALRDLGSATQSIYALNGAMGSTGLVDFTGEADDYWWDHVKQGPGPMALRWNEILQGRPPSQPEPRFVYWVFGQKDSGAIGQVDPAYTTEFYLAQYRALFTWMREQLGRQDFPIVISPYAKKDNNVTPSDRMISAIRWVELDLINNDKHIHLGPALYDLPFSFADAHPSMTATIYQGYRLGIVIDRLLNSSTESNGPKIIGFVRETDTEVSITIEQGMPGKVFDSPSELGHVGVFAQGEDPLVTDPAIVIKQTKKKDRSRVVYTLTLDRSIGDDPELMWPWGAMTSVREAKFPVDTLNVPVSAGWNNHPPLEPIRTRQI